MWPQTEMFKLFHYILNFGMFNFNIIKFYYNFYVQIINDSHKIRLSVVCAQLEGCI